MKRRDFLKTSLAGAALMGGGGALLAGESSPITYPLKVQPARYGLMPGKITEGMVSTFADAPPPVIRLKQGVPAVLSVENAMEEYTAMHWHGLRIPNAMDGVPYLTQFPIGPGEAFQYEFTPPDAGTYWYHPHCMTMTQMALGLTGVMVVEEAEDPGFDSEEVLNLRDFRLNDDGQFIDLYTGRGAARGGTHGTVMAVNWQDVQRADHGAGSLVRLRVAATDTTRIYKLYFEGADGKIIAWDGHPVDYPVPYPTSPDAPLLLSPGQRMDVALRMPSLEGQEVKLMARVPGGTREMAVLRAVGADAGRALAEIAPLPRNPLAEPDLTNPRVEEFVFGWSPEGDLPNNGFCGTLGYTFWSINRNPWAGDAAEGIGPLVTLNMGESVVLRLRNESPNLHPIHLHGLTFRPIRSNKREVIPNMTDTALLLKDEVLDIALVADNPGNWAFHCHVIEHQKTGLAGYIEVV